MGGVGVGCVDVAQNSVNALWQPVAPTDIELFMAHPPLLHEDQGCCRVHEGGSLSQAVLRTVSKD